jgi:hypothetical protein
MVLALIALSNVQALYNGNPALPMLPEQGVFLGKNSWIGLKAGYEWDFVDERNLQLKGNSQGLHRKVRSFDAMGNFGVATFGMADRVEMYGVFGSYSTHTTYRPVSDNEVKFTTDGQFAWEIGGRVILAYWGDLQLGIDAKYFSYSPSIDRLTVNGEHVHESGAGFHYNEWQVGAGVSYRFRYVVPYAGMKYSNVRSKYYHLNAIDEIFPRKHFTLENRYPIGFFLGCGVSLERALDFNAEFRFLDELAVTVAADLRF